MAQARFFTSESVRKAELAVIDSIAAICAQHGLAYQFVPDEPAVSNRLVFRLEFYPDPSLPHEQLVMRRTYHWLCRAHDLPYDLPGRTFVRGGVTYHFAGASLDTPPNQPDHLFIAIDPREKKSIAMTAGEVRAEVVLEGTDALAHVRAGVGLAGLLPKGAPIRP